MKSLSGNWKLVRRFCLVVISLLVSVFYATAQTDTSHKTVPPPQPQPVAPNTQPKTQPNQSYPVKPTQITPVDTAKQKTPHDSLNHSKSNYNSIYHNKLPDAQIKRIVGNDKPAGKDVLGQNLYIDSQGNKYYVSDDGTRIYVK